jgi:hypothetical protein
MPNRVTGTRYKSIAVAAIVAAAVGVGLVLFGIGLSLLDDLVCSPQASA